MVSITYMYFLWGLSRQAGYFNDLVRTSDTETSETQEKAGDMSVYLTLVLLYGLVP